jgi:lysozyme family protein
MKANFEQALKLVLIHEGGYVNHPKDPGGATNQGITHRTYAAWRARQGQEPRNVRDITSEEVREIYRAQYWHKIMADDLPSGLDYAVFDFAVNSGPARAAKFLQEIVGADQDGIIGAQTLDAVAARDSKQLIRMLCASRLAWLKRLKTFATFGKGWTRRVNDVNEAAQSMAAAKLVFSPKFEAHGKAAGAETATATIADVAKDPKAWGGIAALVASLGGIMEGSGPVQYALGAAIVAGVLVAVYVFTRKAAQ